MGTRMSWVEDFNGFDTIALTLLDQDEFAIAYSNYSNQNAVTANNVAYIAPSLTPRSKVNTWRFEGTQLITSFRCKSRLQSIWRGPGYIRNYGFSDIHKYVVAGPTSTSFLQRIQVKWRTPLSKHPVSWLITPSLLTVSVTVYHLAVWKLEYSARDAYGPAIGGWPTTQPLNPAFWHKVTEIFVSNDSLFQKYNAFKTRGVSVPACTGDCKTTTICNLRALRAENGCVSGVILLTPQFWHWLLSSDKHVATPGFNFRRRDEAAGIMEHDHCEGRGLRHIFMGSAAKLVSPSCDLRLY